MAVGVLDQCPICRARLDGAGPCRRCRAELDSVRRVADEGAALAGAGLHRLAAGDRAAALRLIRRASVLRMASDLAWILSALAGGKESAGARRDPDPIDRASP
jgi:hypothetical protein